MVYLDYNISSGPFLSYEIQIGDGPGPELDNYKYVVTVNGKQVILGQIKNPSGFENMKVYDGDPWYPAADAKIKNLLLGFETNGF